MTTKYRVLVIAMCLKDNKIAKHADLVEDTQLNTNPAELVRDGFIELAKDDKNVVNKATDNGKEKNSQLVWDNAKAALLALTPESSDEDVQAAITALTMAAFTDEQREELVELVKPFQVEDTQLDPATEQLKVDYLAAVKSKADLPKDTKPADLAKAGKVISDLKAELVTLGVQFDEDGNIVNSPAKN